MSAYKLLFRILIGHGYYSTAFAWELEFCLSATSQKIMNNAGLILKKETNGICMFFNEARVDILNLYAVDPFEPLSFDFKVFSRNPEFENFTDLPFLKENILFFCSKTAPIQTRGDYRLTRDVYVSQSDLKSMDSKNIQSILTRSERLIRPLCIISIHPQATSGSSFDSTVYFLEFNARKTIWKYYLLGKYTKERVSIVDLENKIMFTQKDNERVSGNNDALVFESDKAIPLTQVPLCRFQLRKQNASASRTLVKTLPAPSPDYINRRMNKENKKEYVSEIFINP